MAPQIVPRVPLGHRFEDISGDAWSYHEPWTWPYANLFTNRDLSGVLRLPKPNFNVPTFNELAKKEKTSLLYIGGINDKGVDKFKVIEDAEAYFGHCKYFDALKCEIYRNRRLKRQIRKQILETHRKGQEYWYKEGRGKKYIANHHYGEIHHEWLNMSLERRTGMVVDRGDEDVPSAVEWPDSTPINIRTKINWHDTSKSDRSQEGRYDWFRFTTTLTPAEIEQYLKKLKEKIAKLAKSRHPTLYIFKVNKCEISAFQRRAFAKFLKEVRRKEILVDEISNSLEIPLEPLKLCSFGSPQMEGRTGEELSEIVSSNVVLTEENPGSSSIAASNRFSFDWHQLCSTETDTSYDYLLNRWTYFKSFTWNINQEVSTEITECKLDMPYDFVNSTDDKGNMPMFVPFKIFKYAKHDIEFKFHVNSNKFQVGQLQFSWQYMEKYDGNPLDNIYSRSQLPHVLINAGASNEATIIIPFKFMQPYMRTTQKLGDLDCLYIGTLRCFVVAPLAVAPKGPTSCGVSVFVRFPNALFTGMRDGGIPQMEAAATAMVAGALVDKFIGDKNCDNRSAPANPQYLVPTASHSWCAGKGLVDHVQNLRLDNSTIAVGRNGIDNNEMSIGVPCRVFGMLKHFEWDFADSEKNKPGAHLFACDVHAQVEKRLVYSSSVPKNMATYALPPMSVISSMFRYWRGSIEFKFDIIASQFHTGRLLCAYIPAFSGDSSSITLAQARNSPHVEFSLQDATNFTFTVPFISDKVWWPRRYTGPHKYGENYAPSRLIVFVLNPLIPMESVVNKVVIVPYVRAGVDFEVSVPVQPSVGLSDNTLNSLLNKDMIFPTEGSYPFRATNYEGFGDDKKYILYEGTAALGTASTFHAPETSLAADEYYVGAFNNVGSCGDMTYTAKDGKVKVGYIAYVVLWNVPDKGNYGIPFPAGSEGLNNAKIVAKELRKGTEIARILPYCYNFITDGTTSVGSLGSLYATPKIYKMSEIADFEIISPQMEERVSAPNTLMPTNILPSTSSGQFNFNEQFNDLKDLGRRYQLYGKKTIILARGTDYDNALAVFPVVPHGLDLDVSNPNSMFNVCRDGHIPIISSGYIFFRGSIRFKLVFACDSVNMSGAKIWVQHHPDGDCRNHVIDIYPNIRDEDGYKSHTYSYYIQNASVNSIIEFEVPFYQNGLYGLTRKMIADSQQVTRASICQYYTLGNIVVGMLTGSLSTKVDVSMYVYYSLSDDFSFNIFRGFPMSVFTDEVWPVVNKPKKKEIVWITGSPQMEDAGDPQMFGMFKKFFVEDPAINVANTVKNHISNLVKQEVEKAQVTFKQSWDKSCKLSVSIPAVTTALGNFAHVLANPTPKTLAISVANVIVSLLANSVADAIKLINVTIDMVTYYWSYFTSDSSGAPQSDRDGEKVEYQFSALIFSTLVGLAGVAVSGPSKFPDVLRGINSSISLYNNSIRLVQNSADLIKYCVKYIASYLNPDSAYIVKMLDDVPDIQKWYKEAVYLLHVNNKDRYLYDKSMMSRVYDACTYGSIIICNGITQSMPGGKVIFDMHKELRKLQSDLFERGAHPDVRFEPFKIWLSGDPGIGKSFMVKKLARQLLQSIEFRQAGSLIYDIPSGAKYWSGCGNPAVLVSDDLFQVSGTRMEDELANIFAICSSSVLNPPMAAVEDKHKRLNPLLYFMLCNSHFPAISPPCTHPEAVFRRRNILLKVRINPQVAATVEHFRDASQLPREITANLGHLEFSYCFNPKDHVDPRYSDWYAYDFMFEKIRADFVEHYTKERQNFRERMQDMYCLDPNFDDMNLIDALPELADQMSLKDQVRIYQQHIQDKLDYYNDPTREPEIADYIKRFVNRVNILKAGNDRAEFQMNEPSDGAGADDPIDAVSQLLAGAPLPSTSTQPEEFRLGLSDGQVAKSILLEENFSDLFEICQQRCNNYKLDNLKSVDLSVLSNIHAYIELLSHNDIDVVDARCYELLDRTLKHKNSMVTTWYTAAVHRLLAIGDFSPLEVLQFISIFKNGPEHVAKLIYGIGDTVKIRDIQFDLDIAVDVECSMKKDDAVKYNNEYKKKALRKAMSTIAFNSSKTSSTAFLCVIHEEVVYTIYNIIEDAKLKAKYSLILDLPTEARCLEAIANAEEDFKNDLPMLTRIMPLLFRLLSSYAVAQWLYGNPMPHICGCRSSYSLLCERPEYGKFCAMRRKLELNGRDVTPCKVKCMYSSQLTYYVMALTTVGCGKFMEIRYDSFGEPYKRYYEFDDVYKALRTRRESLSSNIFFRMGRFLKHWFFHCVPSFFSGIYSAIVNNLPYLFTLLGVLAVSGGINYCFTGNPLVSPAMRVFQHYVFPSGSGDKQANYFKFDNPKHSIKPISKLCPKSFETGSPQISSATRSALKNRIESNTCLLYVTWEEEGKPQMRSCRCLMLRGRSMLVLRHYIEEYDYLVKQGFKITCNLFFKQGKSASERLVRLNVDWPEIVENIAWCSKSDKKLTSNYGICNLPKYVPQFKDIVGMFATYAEHSNVSSVGDLYVVNGDSSFGIPISSRTYFVVHGTASSREVELDKVYTYSRQYFGMCGSLLVSPNLCSGSGGIIGVHVAGQKSSGSGYAEPIYREMFLAFFKEFPVCEVLPVALDAEVTPDFELDSNLLTYGCVPPSFGHKESGKTKIVPSLIHGDLYPVKTQVNPLQPGDKRQPPGSHPLRDGCNKHGMGLVTVFDSRLVNTVKEHLSDTFQQVVRPVRLEVKPLTMQQAVCGDVDVPYFEALNWKSSEGFPLSSSRPKSAHDKTWLFDMTNGEFGYKLNKLHPKLEQMMRIRDLCFERNVKPNTVYVDCLKDARLPIEKCKIPGKTRVFSVAPVQCSIDIRMHVNDFCASVKNSRIVNSIGIGINPNSDEWTKLVLYLSEVGTKIVTLDYSNFGPCLMSQLVAASNEVIVNWHVYHKASEAHTRRVEWLLDNDILNPIHLSGNVVYQTVNGISSGSPLTGECNSIPNLFYIRLTYLEILKEHLPEFATMHHFDSMVRLVVYGDDLIMSVNDLIAPVFNACSIKHYLGKHGIVVTPAQKDSEMVPYTSIYEATFLKRSFIEHPLRSGLWLAPLEAQSIEESINWVHSDDNPEAALIEVARSALDNAYSRGPEYYENFYSKLKRKLNEIGLRIEYKSWHQRDDEIFGEKSTNFEFNNIKIKMPWTYGLSDVEL